MLATPTSRETPADIALACLRLAGNDATRARAAIETAARLVARSANLRTRARAHDYRAALVALDAMTKEN